MMVNDAESLHITKKMQTPLTEVFFRYSLYLFVITEKSKVYWTLGITQNIRNVS